jgi:hypothetical protein
MKINLRMTAGAIILAGSALLASPTPASSTVAIDNGFRYRFCCASDTNGDGQAESYCCYSTGCAIGPTGCVRAS